MTSISYSRLNLYNECSQKFFYRYVEKLESPAIHSPLLFGVAVDETLNFVLECVRDGVPYKFKEVEALFVDHMSHWGDAEILYNPDVMYSLGDVDYYLLSEEDIQHFKTVDQGFEDVPLMKQSDQYAYTKWFKENHLEEWGYLAWRSLYNKGILMLNTFIKDILPKFKRVLDVQTHYIINNGEEDELTVKMDFVAELHDGRVVVFDNKTSSIKYADDSVSTSPQLATYLEFWETIYAGYIVLEKKIRKNKELRWQFIVDEIPEEFTKKVFDGFSEGLYNIKNEVYERNTDSCKSYGRLCEYYQLCHYGKKDNLIPRVYRERKKDESK